MTFKIKNDEDYYQKIIDIVNNYQYENELILYFDDDYYILSNFEYRVDIIILSNISFIGNKNGTIFDYGNDRRGEFYFTFIEEKGHKVKFENIIFSNYITTNTVYYGYPVIYIYSKSYLFFVEINNCTFQYCTHNLIYFDYDVIFNKQPVTNEILTITNSKFYNNTERILSVINHSDKKESVKIKMKGCTFYNNRGLFFGHFVKMIIENCYFSKMDRDSNINLVMGVFFSTGQMPNLLYKIAMFNNDLTIRNSIFENIDVKSDHPLIVTKGLNLE
ncbi:hypothetical protein PIROE2DRAFT_2622 [Piromyces sp. E2]|nr:hypothetical protein PIROE2DRAFT_2622 [Piromyces sp. E2]|eukprot:OUM69524.1 hypothetical protein PIROE2DRAFT_2622 [Piromyces sp. E2]